MNDESEKPQYCVTFRTGTPYYDEDNHVWTRWSDPETLKADTVDTLYEYMARERVDHAIRADKDPESKRDTPRFRCTLPWAELYEVEFSDITVEVCAYDEDRLKATDTWKKLGESLEADRAKRKAEAEQQRKREEAWRAQQQEEQDRANYARLKSKYEGKA